MKPLVISHSTLFPVPTPASDVVPRKVPVLWALGTYTTLPSSVFEYTRFCYADMEGEGTIWFDNMRLSTLFIAVCIPHSLYIIEVWQQWIGVTVFPEAHTGCNHVFLPLFLKNFACMTPRVSMRRPGNRLCQECRLEQLLPLDMHISHLFYPLCNFSALSSPHLQ